MSEIEMSMPPTLSLEDVARVCHEANRVYCAVVDDASQPAWSDAPEWQRESAIAGVTAILEGEVGSARQSHAGWLMRKTREGWVWGPVKDVERREHPCLTPWEKLPAYQRTKDVLFFAVATALLADR